MSFARDWKGPAKWYLDNNGARRNYRKTRYWTAYGWCKAGDRDVLGYMELLRARLRGKWEVLHVDGHVEKRKTKKQIGHLKNEVTRRPMSVQNGA
jgi:hypothetical protein